MTLVRALCCCACGGVATLLVAGASLPLAGMATATNGADSATMNPAAASPAETDSGETSSGETSPGEENPADGSDACAADQACVDSYLWSLYERTPKLDTVKEPQQTKVTVKRKGKTKTVTKTVTKFVGEDFAWKDPKAAEVAGIALMDYVIGGMDPGFRVTLYRALRMLDDAGFKPGIMCAFRDDYRQSIATGLKAQNDRSYHGGSLRGGYGHGLAADIVSVRGETRTERFESTGQMWDFIDKHEKELGIGRPYLNRDPPHIAPLDGEEYATHRLQPKLAQAKAKKSNDKNGDGNHERSGDKSAHAAMRDDRGMAKHEGLAKPSKTKIDGGKHAAHVEPKHAEAQAKSGYGKNVPEAAHNDHGAPKHLAMAKPQGRNPKRELIHAEPAGPRDAKSKRGNGRAGAEIKASSARDLPRPRHL
jgi:hypothetical protein